MCLGPPKPPKITPPAPPPIPLPPPEKPDPVPEAQPLKEEEDVATVTYGSRPSDALLSQRTDGASVVNLNRDSLNSQGANQQGLSGGTMT